MSADTHEKDDAGKIEVNQVDDDDTEEQEGLPAKVMDSPTAPSRQEVLEHNCTHIPFRSWCAHCVRGKAKANKHSITGGSEASDIPIVSFDYAFLSDRDGRAVVEGDEPRIVEDDLSSDDAVIKVLVARDSKSKMCTAIPVNQKGLDPTEWSVRECLKFLEFLGHKKLIMKSDQEEALNAVLRRVRLYRRANTQNMQENREVANSQANGMVERTIQSVEGQLRTLRSAFEDRTGSKVKLSSCIFPWMVIHAANLISLYEIGKDGKVPFQRLRGRKMHPDMVEFGECVHFQPLDYKSMGSAEIRWKDGVFVGIRMHTGEKLVATSDGIYKARSIRRKIEDQRWSVEEINKITGTPWKPYQYSEDDKILTRPPDPVLDTGESVQGAHKSVDENIVPRTFAIQRRDLVNHGYTPACPGCYAAANDRKHKPHTPACRQRIGEALLGDEAESHRIKEARDREDAFLERKVREGDKDDEQMRRLRSGEQHGEKHEFPKASVRELPEPTAPPMQQGPAQDAPSVERPSRITDEPMS